MNSSQFLPYVTSLGLLFVLIGFATLVWTRANSRRFPFLAVCCFAIGIGMAGGSLYAETYYETIDFSRGPIILSQQAHAAIHDCEEAAKASYLDSLAHAKIACPQDSSGWPNRACVAQTDSGALLYEKLHFEENRCYEVNR